MADPRDPLHPDLEARLAEGLAQFAAHRDLAADWIEHLGDAPLSALKRWVRKIAPTELWPWIATLLSVARIEGEANPRRQTELASLALGAVRRLRLPSSVKQALLTEGEALLGDGLRRLARLPQAERAFLRAARHLGSLGDPGQDAFYCYLLANLREDQHRPEEALALLVRAASLFEELGQSDDQAQALFDKAALELHRSDMERALADLRAVIALVDKGLSPGLAAMAIVAYGTLLGDLRRHTEALLVLRAFRERYPDFRNRPVCAELDLLEGSLLLFSEEQAHVASAKLEAARYDFLRTGREQGAAVASLGLALLYLRDDQQAPDLAALIEESIEPLSRSQSLPEETRGALRYFCATVESGAASVALTDRLRDYIASVRLIREEEPAAAARTRAARRSDGD